MITIAVTQRVTVATEYPERRDGLDQRWFPFLWHCRLVPLLLPNHPVFADELVRQFKPLGLLLTGGNPLETCGGNTPERDQVEKSLITHFQRHHLPILGVGKGMLALQHHYGVPLKRVEGHVQTQQKVLVDGQPETLNSFHEWAATETVEGMEVWAKAEDGVIKGIRDRKHKLLGIMWHPERMHPYREKDVALFHKHFTP